MSRRATPVIDASTRDAQDDSFAYFSEFLADVYVGIRPRRFDDGSTLFPADVLAHEFGDDTVLSRMRAPAHGARRDRRSIAASSDDALFLNVAADAPARFEQFGQRRVLRAGKAVLIDNTRPFDLAISARRFRLYSLRIPRRIAGEDLSTHDVEEMNVRLQADPGGRVETLAMLMIRDFDAGRLDVVSALSEALRATLDSLRAEAPHDGDAPTRFAALAALAEAHLDDPRFALADLARLAGCAPRTVQSAFAREETSWSAWASARRLDTARDRIASLAWSHISLARIAAASGFADPSHFHRAFRRRFGDVPGAFRPRP